MTRREHLVAVFLDRPSVWVQYLLAAGAALLLQWALPPQRFGWVAWLALVPLLFAIASAATGRRAFACGWLFGTLMLALAWTWLEQTIRNYGEFSALLSWPLFMLVVGQAALIWGLFAALLWQVRRRWPAMPMALQAPVLLTCAEYLIPTLFESYLGFTQAGYPWITQIADFSGVVGVSFLIAMVNGSLFDLASAALRRQALPWRSLAWTLTLIAAALVYAQVRIAEIDSARALAPKLKIGVVQSNISLAETNNPALASAQLARHVEKSRQLQQRGVELIVWPETAYPYLILRASLEVGQVDLSHALVGELGVPLLVGAMMTDTATADGVSATFNSAMLISPDQRTRGIYDKHLLFPVSEYIPFATHFPRLKTWFPEPRYSAGTQRTVLALGGIRIGPMICVEDLHPSFVRGLVPLRPNLLAAINSDARFGADVAPHQHLAMALFRSIEMRLDMVRASYNGISAIVDAAGRVTVQTRAVDPEALPGVKAFGLTGTVALLDGPQSFYARHGDVFAWLNLLVATVLLMLPGLARRLQRQ